MGLILSMIIYEKDVDKLEACIILIDDKYNGNKTFDELKVKDFARYNNKSDQFVRWMTLITSFAAVACLFLRKSIKLEWLDLYMSKRTKNYGPL